MSTGQEDPGAMGAGHGDPGAGGGGRPPTEEELRAAYEAEIAKVTVEQVLLEHVVTLINLGMRRTGLVPGTESERDATQVRIAIEAIRAQLPLVEQAAPKQISPIREALSQLQLAYVRIGGSPRAVPEPDEQAGATPPAGGPTPPAGGPTPPAEGPTPPAGGPTPPAEGRTPPAGGPAPPGEQEPPSPPKPGEPGPAQRSGRLWVPGQ